MSSAERADDLSEYPRFKLNESRFDQTTFWGRFRHFLDVIDPRTLLVTDIKLQEAVSLLDNYKNGSLGPTITDGDLWEAQKIKQAILHPDTGEKLFMPFRMSGYVPFGTPICVGLLLPNPTMAQTIFWQWLNQSHNACVNYANRNATKPTSMQTFMQGYAGATTAAVSIAIGLTLLVRRAQAFKPATRMLIQRFVPFPAVATASVTNVLLMRRHEVHQGIEVLDSKGAVVGTSKNAAKKCLLEMAVTRFFLPAPILLIPPAVLTQLEKTRWMKRYPFMNLPLNTILCTLSFGLALPLAISIFPQISEISREKLEPEIQQATQDPVLFYNKGL